MHASRASFSTPTSQGSPSWTRMGDRHSSRAASSATSHHATSHHATSHHATSHATGGGLFGGGLFGGSGGGGGGLLGSVAASAMSVTRHRAHESVAVLAGWEGDRLLELSAQELFESGGSFNTDAAMQQRQRWQRQRHRRFNA